MIVGWTVLADDTLRAAVVWFKALLSFWQSPHFFLALLPPDFIQVIQCVCSRNVSGVIISDLLICISCKHREQKLV